MTAFFDLPVRRIPANGMDIAARIDGSGPPLLLLHGHPQTHAISRLECAAWSGEAAGLVLSP